MKVVIIQQEDEEEEIIIKTKRLTSQMKQLISYIEQMNTGIRVYQDKQEFQLSIDAIYYIETIDNTTIVYTQYNSYQYKGSLTSLQELLNKRDFCRISKQAIVHLSCIRCIEPYANHRLLLVLKNEEKLLVNRSYMEEVKYQIRNGGIFL